MAGRLTLSLTFPFLMCMSLADRAIPIIISITILASGDLKAAEEFAAQLIVIRMPVDFMDRLAGRDAVKAAVTGITNFEAPFTYAIQNILPPKKDPNTLCSGHGMLVDDELWR
jgi:hypothetical protein